MWRSISIVAVTVSLLLGSPAISCAQRPADNEISIEFRGRLAVAADPAAKEPRIIVTAGSGLGTRTFLLAFGEDKELPKVAAQLDGRTVLVTGRLGGAKFEYSGGGGFGSGTLQAVLDQVRVVSLKPVEEPKK